MNKFVLLLCAVLALSVTGCGSSKAETPAPTAIPAATEAPPAETKVPEATPAPEVTPEPAAESSEAEKQIALVKELIGRPVAELYAAIGEPSGGSDYGPSCLVTGGTVYTLVQPDGSESMYDVE